MSSLNLNSFSDSPIPLLYTEQVYLNKRRISKSLYESLDEFVKDYSTKDRYGNIQFRVEKPDYTFSTASSEALEVNIMSFMVLSEQVVQMVQKYNNLKFYIFLVKEEDLTGPETELIRNSGTFDESRINSLISERKIDVIVGDVFDFISTSDVIRNFPSTTGGQNLKQYVKQFSFFLQKEYAFLSCFSFCVATTRKDLFLFDKRKDKIGPLNGEYIKPDSLSQSRTTLKATNGTIWAGTYHSTRSGYSKGLLSSQDEEILVSITENNQIKKIQNLSSLSGQEADAVILEQLNNLFISL